jgi:arylsulfatase A-like enzyme
MTSFVFFITHRAIIFRGVICWFACVICWQAVADDRYLQKKRPNILFCIADDASFAHFGANGCSWVNTPGFDRVAEQGIRFTRAYTPNAKCAPSRSCILTGRNSWQLEAAANHNPIFPPKFQTFCEALAEKGYYVASSGKGWGPGVALDENGKKRDMTGVKYDRYTYTPVTSKMCNIVFGRNF